MCIWLLKKKTEKSKMGFNKILSCGLERESFARKAVALANMFKKLELKVAAIIETKKTL